MTQEAAGQPRSILVIDVGGTHVKVKHSGGDEEREVASGPTMTPAEMVAHVREMTRDWSFDAVTMGYPVPVLHGRVAHDPHNLGPGWTEFEFAEAFGKPLKIVNDAAMQALGSYEGGVMLFVGLGTGLGTALVIDGRNAKRLKELPPNCRLGDNANAFEGGFRMWGDS